MTKNSVSPIFFVRQICTMLFSAWYTYMNNKPNTFLTSGRRLSAQDLQDLNETDAQRKETSRLSRCQLRHSVHIHIGERRRARSRTRRILTFRRLRVRAKAIDPIDRGWPSAAYTKDVSRSADMGFEPRPASPQCVDAPNPRVCRPMFDSFDVFPMGT